MPHSLVGLAAPGRPVFGSCSKCCIAQDVCCEVSDIRVTVATSAMLRNFIRKTLLKVTMSMMTTMTTVLHQDLENAWSSSLLFHSTCCLYSRCSFGLHRVAASSLIGLHDSVLICVVTPLFRSSHVLLPFQRSSVEFFHIGLRVSLFVRALVAHQCSARRSFRNCASSQNLRNLLLI